MVNRILNRLQRLSPGMALLLLAPVLGELVSGHQTLFQFINPLAFVLSALPYGCGAIVCRELKIRWDKGWVSLALLGIAYGLYEEALVARSFWDPDWAELGALRDYSYWRGVVWTYFEVLIHFHLTISILASVILTEILYPDQRRESWVSNRGLIACFVGLGIWMVPLVLINPFMPPWPGFIATIVTIVGLIVLARIVPARVFPARPGLNVRPLWYGVIGVINVSVTFIAIFTLPEIDPSWLPSWPVMFTLIAMLNLLTFGVLLWWSGNGADWDDRHKLLFVIGLLAFFLVMDFFSDLERFGGLSIVAVVTILALRKVWLNVQSRYASEAVGAPELSVS